MKETLMQRLIRAGYPESQMFHHESDLYVFATSLTDRVIDEWCREEGFKRSLFVEPFHDCVTRRTMFDIAFQYDTYWTEIAKKEGGAHE